MGWWAAAVLRQAAQVACCSDQVSLSEFVQLFEARLPWDEREFMWIIDQFRDVRGARRALLEWLSRYMH